MQTRITSSNSNAIYDHGIAQNPLDIISDGPICVEAVWSDEVKSCKLMLNLLQIINSIMYAKFEMKLLHEKFSFFVWNFCCC